MALFLGRLSLDTRSRDLEELFNKYGRVTRLDIKRGTNSGFGFVEYEDARDAEEAARKLNGHVVNGNPMVVEFAKNSTRRAGENECFKCGKDGMLYTVIGLATAAEVEVELVVEEQEALVVVVVDQIATAEDLDPLVVVVVTDPTLAPAPPHAVISGTVNALIVVRHPSEEETTATAVVIEELMTAVEVRVDRDEARTVAQEEETAEMSPVVRMKETDRRIVVLVATGIARLPSHRANVVRPSVPPIAVVTRMQRKDPFLPRPVKKQRVFRP
ncbi:hypothetical protein KVV02_001093 [Mortierella alpina]|uniref:RRM domain-containing protein n=1 Tax=Mortierella alpina TaxID=64518 RepID=A0A9P8A975_MORAP|nr:hypothetical protein KVV02_001093 [Mortierella alpina]